MMPFRRQATQSRRPSTPPAVASTTLSTRNCGTTWRATRRAPTGPQLALPDRAAREQQVRDVRAGDEQHEADRAEQQPERRDRVRVEEVVLERLDARAPARVRARDDRRRSAWPRDTMSALACASVTPGFRRPRTSSQWKSWLSCSGVNASGRIQLALESIRNAGRQHADDRVRLAVDANLAAQDRRIRGKPGRARTDGS